MDALVAGSSSELPAFFANLAGSIKQAREAADLSQTELAEVMGTRQSFISKLESANNVSMSIQTLHAVATALGCELSVKLTRPAGTLVAQEID